MGIAGELGRGVNPFNLEFHHSYGSWAANFNMGALAKAREAA